MRRLLLSAVALAAAWAVFAPAPARAWHKEGHMTVALIAYRQLNGTKQTAVHELLKKHPHYDLFLAADKPADADLDEWVVVRAAIWPDWVKQPTSIANRKTRSEITRNFSHGAWHFVNKPIRHFDGTTEAEREAIEANIANPKKKRGEIMEKLPKLIAGLKGEGNVNLPELVWGGDPNEVGVNEGQARAIALCWVLHLVGDIHQPLHAATLFSKDSPDGDQGGNNFIVRLENHATNLHAIWDGEFGWDKLKGPNDSQFAVVDGLAHDLVARIRPTTVQREEMRLEKWADESFRLAESKAYFSSTQQLLPGEILRPQEHRPHASELDPLPAGYAGLVKKTAEQRVTLAGYRMGTLLGDLV